MTTNVLTLSQPSVKLVGNSVPRIFTPPLRELTPETSRGFELIAFARDVLGEKLLPWQEWLFIHALELNEDGTYRFRTVVVLAARQQGKTFSLRTLSLWRMYVDGAELVLGVAQNRGIASEVLRACDISIRANPFLDAEHLGTSRTNGKEQIELENGSRYLIAAADGSAGRGLPVDQVNIDELREQRDWAAWSALSKTTTARTNAMLWAFSNAGDDRSVVLNQLRDQGITAIASGAHQGSSLGLFEWSAPDDCDLDDPDGWQAANPSLGHVPSILTAIQSALSTDPPGVFRTEVLCQRVKSLDEVINLDAWQSTADPSGSLDAKSKLHLCVDISPDNKHATLAAAALTESGKVRVEVVADFRSPAELRDALDGHVRALKPVSVGWFPGGPAGALKADLGALKRSVELKSGDVPAVCMGFAEQVSAGQVIHSNNPLLTAHVMNTQRLISGDGWRFTRRGDGHVDAAYAAAGAVHLARTQQSLGPIRIIFGSESE